MNMKEDEMKEIFRKVLTESGLVDNIEQIKNTCEQTKAKLDKINTEVETLKIENAGMKSDLKRVEEENKELKAKLSDLDQYGRKNDVIIQNIPEVENENLVKVLAEVANKIGVSIREFDITVAHRLPTKKGVRPVIVRFHSAEKKKEIMKAAKTIKPAGRDLGLNTTAPIYFDDHLSRETKQRWFEAREMVDAGILFSAKCVGGKIRVKEKQDGPVCNYGSRDSIRYNEWKKRGNGKTRSAKRNMEERSPENGTNQDMSIGNNDALLQQTRKISRTEGQTTVNNANSGNVTPRRNSQPAVFDIFKQRRN